MSYTNNLVFAVLLYAFCSGSMLFLNKLALTMSATLAHRFLPGSLSCIQLSFALMFCGLLKVSGMVTFPTFTSQILKMYSIYGFLFVGSVYASMMALEGSNVETQIVFRAATPITVSLLDYLFLGRELPSRKSLLSLFLVAVGALTYVQTDAEFALNGFGAYAWVSLYYFLICAEMTIGKYMLSAVKMENVWSSVLLTNGCSLPILTMLSYARGDFVGFGDASAEASPELWTVIFMGCIVGTSIGYSSWNCRGLMSATYFTLVGVVNKFLTVLLSVFFLDKHASGQGIAALMCCIIASTQYEQAPHRAVVKESDNTTVADESHKKLLAVQCPEEGGILKEEMEEEMQPMIESRHLS